MSKDLNQQTDNTFVSKTRIKKEMNELQDLGKRLISLSKQERTKLNISSSLEEAIQDYAKMKSNGAERRHIQFVGRLMRELDEESVQIITNYFSIQDGDNKAHSAYVKRLENIRDLLISDDNALTEYVNQHPEIEPSYLRTLIRNHKKELERNKPSKSYREIYHFLKEVEPFDYQL